MNRVVIQGVTFDLDDPAWTMGNLLDHYGSAGPVRELLENIIEILDAEEDGEVPWRRR